MKPGDEIVCTDPGSCVYGESGLVVSVGADFATVRWLAIGTIGRLRLRALAEVSAATAPAAAGKVAKIRADDADG